jgi:CBS domain-containing protein
MTPFPYAIELDRTLGDAERMMLHRSIRHLPVTSEGEVYGILSAREIQLALATPDADAWQIQVKEVCAPDPYIADTNEPLEAVLTEMATRHIGCAVIAEDDRVAGIFTTVDACRVFAAHLRQNDPANRLPL